MGRKKVDVKIRMLIKHCTSANERSLFCVLGQKAQYQVVIFHHLLCKSQEQSKFPKLSILWCFKKDNGYSYVCQKKQRMLKKKFAGSDIVSEEDCFDFFLASADIQFCHYNDTTSVLGQTFNMLVIQDFEAVTPNILSRVAESVKGGGIIILLFPMAQSLEEIASMNMDAHSRYVTSAHSRIDPVFNSRFLLSLAHCNNCMILDDNLRIMLCSFPLEAPSSPKHSVKRKQDMKIQNGESDSSDILNEICLLCCTADQRNAVKTFITTLSEKSCNSVISLTSARGRGKSASLGLSIACALYLKFSNIYVTSPHLENIQTLFSFMMKGVDILKFEEGKDYTVMHSSVENKTLVCGINVFHDHKQTVKYLNPTEFTKVGISDLVIIDEAAAIPLPVVKKWLKSNVIFMASTVNGYEGTGRSLSLKLMSQLRELSQQSVKSSVCSLPMLSETNFILKEIELNEAIRYADGDAIERWLNSLFCLSSEISYLSGDIPDPENCQLYYVNRKSLFSCQSVAEKFLQQLVALFVSSHYKNSPNDLLMMADAPSHHLFCLLPLVDRQAQCIPDVLCVIQVALEGQIECVIEDLSHGKRASGDLIPWIISQQFQDDNFPTLSGARIVRIATHPNYQRLGYGKRALELLFSYYTCHTKMDSQCQEIKDDRLTLLLSLAELPPVKLDYIGVSYGLTLELLKFWKKLEFVPLYIRQTASETTGEHSCIMIKPLKKSDWLANYLTDFIHRFTTLLMTALRNLPTELALEILHCRRSNLLTPDCTVEIDMQSFLSTCSLKRLEAYCNHLVDYHLIMDLMPVLARAYFLNYFRDNFLSSIQETILLSMGLQSKSVEEISLELNMETGQIMGLFMKTTKKILTHFRVNNRLSDSNHFAVENKNLLRKEESLKRKKDKDHLKQKKKHRHNGNAS